MMKQIQIIVEYLSTELFLSPRTTIEHCCRNFKRISHLLHYIEIFLTSEASCTGTFCLINKYRIYVVPRQSSKHTAQNTHVVWEMSRRLIKLERDRKCPFPVYTVTLLAEQKKFHLVFGLLLLGLQSGDTSIPLQYNIIFISL